MAVGPDPQPKLSLPSMTYPAMPTHTFHTSLNVTKEISLISKGSFVVLKPIGKGSMGVVFLIKSIERDGKEGNELFAMKEMDYERDAELDDRFKLIQREIRILSHLSHPNIVHYYTSMISVRDSCIQLVQEFCNRSTLYHVVRERIGKGEDYYTEKEVLTWSCQLSSAVVYLHDSKILHRDLKSQNIFLTSPLAESNTTPHNTIIKLGDFGISRPLETTCDLASTCVGTPAYMAPEVCHKNLYSYPCDMWSLGCVLVEMCSLKPAFQSTGLVTMVFKILNADYTQIPGIYSKSLSDLIDSLFCVEPELRPTAKQVMSILTELIAECNTADEYDNDFDSPSDNSATTNLEDSQRMTTLSLSQDTLTQPINEIAVMNREISQHSDCYSDDFDSFSENEDG